MLRKIGLLLSISLLALSFITLTGGTRSQATQYGCGQAPEPLDVPTPLPQSTPTPVLAQMLFYPDPSGGGSSTWTVAPTVLSITQVTQTFGSCGERTMWRVNLSNGINYYFAREPVQIQVTTEGVTAYFE